MVQVPASIAIDYAKRAGWPAAPPASRVDRVNLQQALRRRRPGKASRLLSPGRDQFRSQGFVAAAIAAVHRPGRRCQRPQPASPPRPPPPAATSCPPRPPACRRPSPPAPVDQSPRTTTETRSAARQIVERRQVGVVHKAGKVHPVAQAPVVAGKASVSSYIQPLPPTMTRCRSSAAAGSRAKARISPSKFLRGCSVPRPRMNRPGRL